MMQDFDELRLFTSQGEFSTTGVLTYLGVDYPVSGIYSDRFKRKEVDGQLTTDLPMETVSYQIPLSQIPVSASRDSYKDFVFTVDGVERKVRYVTGIDPVSFYLLPPSED